MLSVSYNPYSGVDWSNEQRYGQLHAHIRGHTPPETETRYERAGNGVLMVGDAPCRTDFNQEHFYWPWVNDPSTYTAHHAEGIVGIPGSEYDGGGLDHVAGVNTQVDPVNLGGCGSITQEELIDGILNNPEIGSTSLAILCHPQSYSTTTSTYEQWITGREGGLIGQETWHRESGDAWDEYHQILDNVTRQWWHFAGDDYADDRSGEIDSTRVYFMVDEWKIENVLQALIDGRCYSARAPDTFDGTDSTLGSQLHPPEIESINIDPVAGDIEITSSAATACEWTTAGGTQLTTGFTLSYRDHSSLDGSWAYATVSNSDGDAATQPFSFDETNATERLRSGGQWV